MAGNGGNLRKDEPNEEDPEEQYDYIRFTCVDINGIGRSRIVPGWNGGRAMKTGLGVYAGLLTFGPKSQVIRLDEIDAVMHGNATLLPEDDTLHEVTWSGGPDHRVGEYFCDIYWTSGCPQKASPRFLAKQQCAKLEERGLRLMSAFELEFTLLEEDTGLPAWRDHGMFTTNTMGKFEALLFEVEKAVRAAGVQIECIHAEHGRGQCEFTFSPQYGCKSADNLFITKQALKEISPRQKLMATFMAKPFAGEAGNGLHFNHSLWDIVTGVNAFHADEDIDGLSKQAHHWLAGLAHHARALTALCCPTVNCYRRIHGLWAPTCRGWGKDNRRKTFRVKSGLPPDTYIESRLPSGCANPYIVIAATISAGLDGINRQLDFPIYQEETDKLLPRNLGEAIRELQSDDIIRKALGEQFIRWFSESKMQVDLTELHSPEQPSLNYTAEDADQERDFYARFM